MSDLNRAAQQVVYDVTAISSVVYPQIAADYAILSVGTSVGRGYGPVLVSRDETTPADLRGRRVGVGGIPTTGWFLLRRLCPDAIPVEMPFDRIGEAVASGELDAGVMIHEELLYYPRLGLRRVIDLGAWWCDETGLPLPVGLNVVRRSLGDAAHGPGLRRDPGQPGMGRDAPRGGAGRRPRVRPRGGGRLHRAVRRHVRQRGFACGCRPTCGRGCTCCAARPWTWAWPTPCRRWT